jgi:hypothetical protein
VQDDRKGEQRLLSDRRIFLLFLRIFLRQLGFIILKRGGRSHPRPKAKVELFDRYSSLPLRNLGDFEMMSFRKKPAICFKSLLGKQTATEEVPFRIIKVA